MPRLQGGSLSPVTIQHSCSQDQFVAVLLCWVLFPSGVLLQEKGKSLRGFGNLREAEAVPACDERHEQASAARGWLLGGPMLVFLSMAGPCTHPKSTSAHLLQRRALGIA